MISTVEQERHAKRPNPISEWFNDASREQAPLAHRHVEAEYGAPKNPEESRDAIILRERALGIKNINRANAATDEEELEENKEKKEELRRRYLTAQIFEWTKNDFMDALQAGNKFDQTLMGMFVRDVQDQDMLRGADGKPVETLEQKQKMEAEGRNCSGLLAQDEVVKGENGRLMTKQDFTINMLIKERIDYRTEIFAKLDKGEMSADQVPEELKKDLKDRQYINAMPTFYDRIMIGQSALKIDAPKNENNFETSGGYTFKQQQYVAGPAPSL